MEQRGGSLLELTRSAVPGLGLCKNTIFPDAFDYVYIFLPEFDLLKIFFCTVMCLFSNDSLNNTLESS